MLWRAVLLAVFSLCLSTSIASADDWKIVKIGGDARVFRDGAWAKLKLGDVVSDDSVVHTLADSAMQLTRDKESISLAADTEIQIQDRVGERYTTVHEHFGTVGVEANIDNVKHFAVQTPFMAAAVKGTIFGVRTDSSHSTLVVQRGLVEVTDAKRNTLTDVPAGQAAKVNEAHGVTVVYVSMADEDVAAASKAASAASMAAPAPDEEPDQAGGAVKAAKALYDSKTPGAKSPALDARSVMAKLAEIKPAASQTEIRWVHEPEFSWVERRNGDLILTPLRELVFKLKGVEAWVFWPCAGILFLLLGFLFQSVLQDAAFGVLVNTLISLVAAVFGALLRDWLFANAGNLPYEPFLSLGLILSMIAVFMLAACAVRSRLE